MIWRTQQGEQPQRWAISALRTPPRDRRMTLACRRLTALDSCRFIACSFLPSQGRSVLATTVSTIGSPHHNGCSNNRWRTYLRSKAARWKPSVRPGESHELETALVEQRVRQDVHVDLHAVGDLVAPAAAAALRVRGVIQPVDRIDDADPACQRHALQRAGRAVQALKRSDVVDRVEDRVVHPQ